MMPRAALLAALCALPLAAALFEDQAGKVDWYRQHIGQVKHALFHSAGQAQRLALVATEPGVVAGLDLRSGKPSWRSVLPAGEQVQLLEPHGKSLVSVSTSASGAFVRLWGMTGGLTWDAHIPRTAAPASAASDAPPVALVSGTSVIVGYQSKVSAFHTASGSLLWEWAHEGGASMRALLHAPAVAADGSATSTAAASTSGASSTPPMPPLHVYGVGADGDVVVVVLEKAAPGKGGVSATSTKTLRGGKAEPSSSVVATLDRNYIAVVEGGGGKVLLHSVGSGSGSLIAQPIPSLEGGATASLSPAVSLPSALLLSTSAGASLLVKLGSGGALSVSRQVDSATKHSFGVASSREGKAVVSLSALTPKADAIMVETVQIDADGTIGEWSTAEKFAYDFDHLGAPVASWLNVYGKKDGSFGHRLLVSSEEHSLQLLQGGTESAGYHTWLRQEALATIERSELLPLPALATDAADTSRGRPFFGMALGSLVTGIQSRMDAFKALSAGEADFGPPPTHTDSYGLRQAIVAATSAGKLFGLHSSDGSTLWSRRIPSPSAADDGAPAKLPHLFVCRGGGGAQAVVVAQGSDAWSVSALSPFSGKELSKGFGGAGKILHAARLDALAAADGSTRPPVMLVDDSLSVRFYPSSPETHALIDERVSDLFFYIFDQQSGALNGYAVTKKGPGGADGVYAATPRWSMMLPPASAGVHGRPAVSLASFPTSAAVHSPVRVLGDRNVLHKYVNRNLLAIGVEHAGDGSDFDEPSLQLMLVDTVSGRVVYTVRYQDAVGPLTMLMGENWLVWHYWSPKQLTYQMAVAELFTNTSGFSDDPVSLVLSGGPDYSLRENGFDAFSHAPPHALTQGYVFAAGLSAMAVTQTVAGLTPKFVLAATHAGQLVLLDKRFLDPRRPIVPGGPQKMSMHDREEGLVPYGPSLGAISPLSVASHRHTVARPRAVVAAPTYLESTSLAFVTGLDLFCTRVAPAREFDRLGEDFNYVGLVLAVGGMTAATLLSGWYANKKDLARAWK